MAGPARKPRRFQAALVRAIDEIKYLGVRAGARSDHRFIAVWPVVIRRRVFARSWSRKPGGWYRTFLDDPLGTIQVGERRIRIRAIPVRSAAIRQAMERAYAVKYPTPGSKMFVRGFKTAARRVASMEFVPR